MNPENGLPFLTKALATVATVFSKETNKDGKSVLHLPREYTIICNTFTREVITFFGNKVK